MVTEMMVALMAHDRSVRAYSLDEYFAINVKGTPTRSCGEGSSAAAFPVSEDRDEASSATNLGEKTMFGRAGGAPTFAVGMAAYVHGAFHRARRRWRFRYHFRHHVRSAVHLDYDRRRHSGWGGFCCKII